MLLALNPNGYIVRVSENALIQLCQASLEAYSVLHQQTGKKQQEGLETYGLLWGHEIRMTNGQTLYQVEMALVDTSALRQSSWCLPSEHALELKRDIMTSFWPHLEFLGDFHSHPYRSLDQAIRAEGWSHSAADVKRIETQPDFIRSHRYCVALVLAIGKMRRASNRQHRWREWNTIEFTLGNYRLWLKAHVVFDQNGTVKLVSDEEQHVSLECPTLMGTQYEYTPFGRAAAGQGPGHRLGTIYEKPETMRSGA